MIPLPVASLIPQANVGPLVVTRRGAPVKSASGAWAPGPAASFSVDPIACYTVTGRDLQALPDADRSKDVRRFICRVRIRVAGEGVPPDVITYLGNDYEAKIAHDYAENGGVWIVDAVRLEG